MPLAYLVTHSGGFHADELFSSVSLTGAFPDAELIRSRAPEWITPGSDRIIYDVGGAYDADAGIATTISAAPPCAMTDSPLSSFGLIWRHYGRHYLEASGVSAEHVEAVHA